MPLLDSGQLQGKASPGQVAETVAPSLGNSSRCWSLRVASSAAVTTVVVGQEVRWDSWGGGSHSW